MSAPIKLFNDESQYTDPENLNLFLKALKVLTVRILTNLPI